MRRYLLVIVLAAAAPVACTSSDVLLEVRADAGGAESGPGCAPADGACGTPCGGATCAADQICRALEVGCAVRGAPPLPLMHECVPRPAVCTDRLSCACAGPLTCPTTAIFCREAGEVLECHCRA
jgi:hypothetical protein